MSGDLQTSGGRAHQEGELAGAKVGGGHILALLSQCHDPASPKLVFPSSVLPSVRLFAPDSLQVTHLGAQKCNITWTVSQSSHYIEQDLEFEVRTKFQGHSWEVSTWPGLTCPDSPFPSWAACPSFTSAKAQQPPGSPCCFSVLPAPASPSLHMSPDNPGVPAGSKFQAGTGARHT